MTVTVYRRSSMTGGGADALDGIPGTNLVDGQPAFVFYGGNEYSYVLDDDSGAAESSPDIIEPDVDGGDKRWILQGVVATSLTVTAQANDIDMGGYYLTSLQNTADMLAGGPGYWFDGTAKITFADNANLEFSTKFSIIVAAKTSNASLDLANTLAAKYNITANNREYCFELTADEKLRVLFGDPVDGTYEGSYLSDSAIDGIDSPSVYGTSYNAGDCAIYKDGTIVEATATSVPSSLYNGNAELQIGNADQYSATQDFAGEIYRALIFNLALTAAEVKAFSSGAPIPYKYIGASQTELDSGSLTIGKAYRITAQDGEDFTADGAASNDVGTEFVATGTNVTLDANDKVTQIGCVLDLSPDGIGHGQWIDRSGNELHGTVSGAIPTNLPVNHMEKYVDLTVTGDTSFTLPAGYLISSITTKETAGNSVGGGIDFGTTDGGGEVVAAHAVTASTAAICALVAGANYNLTGADDTIYITDADGTGWDSASVEIRVQMQRIDM